MMFTFTSTQAKERLMGFLGKVGSGIAEAAKAATQLAGKVADAGTVPEQIGFRRAQVADIDQKLAKLGWSSGTKAERQALTAERTVLNQKIDDLVARYKARTQVP